MSSTYKITLFFSNRTNGWSETYYWAGASITVAYDAAIGLRDKRVLLMATPTKLEGIRVNDVAAVRVSTLTPQPPDLEGIYNSRSDLPSTAAMMRCYNTDASRTRPLYLRGNPDNAFDDELPNNADAQTWKNRYLALGSFLAGGGGGLGFGPWSIQVAPRPNPNTNSFPVLTWSATTPSTNTSVIVPDIVGKKVGDTIVFYKMKGLPFPPGRCTIVKATNPAVGSYEVRYRTPSDYTYPGNGRAVFYEATYEAIGSFSAEPRWTRRATGRPSDVSRGRRRSIPR